MADISTVTLPSGSTYNLKDAEARQAIADIETAITGAMHYIGITTTALTDGSTTATIVIDGVSKTLTASDAGSVVIYGEKEYVWNGTKWQEFGSTGSLKALAFKDTASATYKPKGTVSKPTFTGTQATITSTGTPAGTVSQPTFTGTEGSVSVSGTPSGSVTISTASSGTANYTPAGTVSQPTTTVTPNTTTVNSITAVGTLPTWTATVANENLTIGWSQGTLPTKGSNTTVVTGIQSAVTTQPTFTGTGAVLKGTFSGNALTSTGSFTPAGSVSQPTFSGSSLTSTATYTPAGSVSQPTFTGTEETITVS